MLRWVAVAAFAAGIAVAVYLAWNWLLVLAVFEGCRRILFRWYGLARPRRGRSTVAQLVQATGVAYAAWNSRHLKPRRPRTSKGTVELKSGLVLTSEEIDELFR